MGKYMRKSKVTQEIAVMEVAHVGVKTRARALAMAAAASSETTTKRTKVRGGELKFSSSLVHLRSSGGVVVTSENSVSPATSVNSGQDTSPNDHCSSPGSDRVMNSCCSSNASSDLEKKRFKIVDLENESVQLGASTYDSDCSERRETMPSREVQAESGDLESTARPSEAISRRRSSAEKMPSETEIEEFFAAAENDLLKRFTNKYNYDIVKDVPLEGRFEWVQIKP